MYFRAQGFLPTIITLVLLGLGIWKAVGLILGYTG